MKSTLFLILGVILLLGNVKAIEESTESTEFITESGITVLRDSNFDIALETYDRVLVEFYAPWCGYCQKLSPEYIKAQQIIKDAGSDTILAKVDSTKNPLLKNRYNIENLPTIYFFDKKEKKDCHADRNADDIARWVLKGTGFQVLQINTSDELKQFRDNNKVGIVFFGKPDGATWELFDKVATSDLKLNYVFVSDQQIMKEAKVSENTIVVYKQFGDKQNIYKGALVQKDLVSFIHSAQLDVVMEFDQIGIQAVFHRRNPTIFFFDDDSNESKEYFELFKQAAAANQDRGLLFLVTSPSDGHGQWDLLGSYLRIELKESPMIRYVHMEPSKVNQDKLEGSITTESIQDFVDKHAKKQPKNMSDEKQDL